MLDVTIDLITQTASSSLFAFCFCNLIIVIIIMGSKPGSEFDQEQNKTHRLEMSSTTIIANDKESFDPKDETDENEKELLAAQVNEDVDKCEEVLEEEEDDELRKRFEDFIQMVNKGWKAELLKTSNLIEA